MELAIKIQARIPHTRSLELLPRYLIPPECAEQGWVDVDGNLGICNKVLAKAYVELCVHGIEAESPEASLLSLLATTENVHVVNSRKRFCITGSVTPLQELHILDVLLSSHLYRHTKSPLLWSHRRWLIDVFALPTTIEREWSVVSAAALRHPRNYYAWGYMRWWCTNSDIFHSPDMAKLVEWTAQLSKQNLSDVSIWTFLAWLDVPELNEFARRTNDELPGHPAILASSSLRLH